MGNFKKIFLGVLALIVVASNVTLAEAAKKNKEEQTNIKVEEKKEPIPVIIEGDDITFNEQTGEIYAKGKVVFTQADAVVTGTDIEGNTIKTKVWAKDKTLLSQPDLKLNGYETDYNYGDRTGTMKKVDGVVNNKIVKGNNVEFYPERVVIYNGTITKCPAIKPDYHISAKKIEIYPNVKMIAYDVKVWAKDKVMYSTAKYETSLDPSEKQNSIYPDVGYNSDGFYVKQHFEEPVSNNLSAFLDLDYYSEPGFKPHYGLINRFAAVDLILQQGNFQDSDEHWIKKKPEWRVQLHKQRLFDLPVSYVVNAIYGKWEDETKSSWHEDYNIYFSRDTIKISEKMNLNLGTGYQIVKESYNNSENDKFIYDITLSDNFDKKWNGWIGYHYVQNNSTLFNYDSDDLSRELITGLTYAIDDKNSLSFVQRYDLDNSRVYDQDYTWYHDLHCLKASLTYRAKREEIKFRIGIKEW